MNFTKRERDVDARTNSAEGHDPSDPSHIVDRIINVAEFQRSPFVVTSKGRDRAAHLEKAKRIEATLGHGRKAVKLGQAYSLGHECALFSNSSLMRKKKEELEPVL